MEYSSFESSGAAPENWRETTPELDRAGSILFQNFSHLTVTVPWVKSAVFAPLAASPGHFFPILARRLL
jgi:hypothetical protein